MITGLYSFEKIVQDVAQETGITNLRNRYGELRQLIARAEREINPYAGFLIKKKMKHFVGNGVFDGKSIKKPDDYVHLDRVGCCDDGLCDGAYYETVSHIVICDKKERTEITWTYWGLQFDGNGNPVTSYNHAEAVVAYLVWKLYSPKVFLGEGSIGLKNQYQQDWENRCMESRGEDMFPSVSGMDAIFKMNKWASLHFENMTTHDRCLCCESCLVTIEEEEPMEPTEQMIYYWQLDNVAHRIEHVVPLITVPFVESKPSEALSVYAAGTFTTYTGIGAICFAIKESEFVNYKITDTIGVDRTNNFDRHYFEDLKIMLYVSKNHHSHSSIYFKIKTA